MESMSKLKNMIYGLIPRTLNILDICVASPRCGLGCSLFIKNALYFTGIESCSCVTEIGLKILELMVFVIGKNAPRNTHLGGNPTIAPNFFTIWENFLVFF